MDYNLIRAWRREAADLAERINTELNTPSATVPSEVRLAVRVAHHALDNAALVLRGAEAIANEEA